MSLLDKIISSSYNENKIIKRMSDLSYSALDGQRQEVISYAPEGVVMPGQISREKPLDAITKEMIKQYQEEQNVPAEVIGGVPMKYRKAGYEPLFKLPIETDTLANETKTIFKNSLAKAKAIKDVENLLNDLDKSKQTLKKDIDTYGLTFENQRLSKHNEEQIARYTEQLKQLKKEYENDKFEINRRVEMVKNIKRQNALAIQENKEEVQRFQNEFIQMNRNRLNIQQQPYESDMDYYNRLKAIEKEQFDPVLYKQISLNENIKQLKPKLLSLFKEDVIEDVIKGLSDEDKFIVNKNFDLISKQFLSKNGFNPNISPSAAAAELMNIFQEATSAAAKLQALFKRKNVIDEGEDYATQKQAVLDLQAAFKRKKIAGIFPASLQKHREIQQKILEGQSASKIQSVFKGYLGRKQGKKYTWDELNVMSIEDLKDMLLSRGYGNPDGSIRAPRKEATRTIPADPPIDVLIYNAWDRKLRQGLSSSARSGMVERELARAGIIAPRGEALLPGSSALSALTTVPASGTFTPTPTPLQDITAATKLQAAYRGFKVREGDIIPKKAIERATKKSIFQGIKKRAEEMKFLEKVLKSNVVPKQKFFDIYKEGFRKSKDETEAERLVQLSMAAQRPEYTRDELETMSIEDLKNILRERGYLTNTGIRAPRKEATTTIPADPEEDRLVYNVYNNKMYKAFKTQQKLEKQGATTIQAAIRGRLASNELNLKKQQIKAENKQKIEALTKIQNTARNYIEKVRIKKEKDRVEAEAKAELAKIDEDAKNALKQETSATTLQAAIRGRKGQQQYKKASVFKKQADVAVKELEQAKQVRKQQAEALKGEADVLQQELNALKREAGAATIQAALKGKRGQQQYRQALAFKEQVNVAANQLEQAKQVRKQQAEALKDEADALQQELNALKRETGAATIQAAIRGKKGEQQYIKALDTAAATTAAARAASTATKTAVKQLEQAKQIRKQQAEALKGEADALQQELNALKREAAAPILQAALKGKRGQQQYRQALAFKEQVNVAANQLEQAKQVRKQQAEALKGEADALQQELNALKRETGATAIQGAFRGRKAREELSQRQLGSVIGKNVKRLRGMRFVKDYKEVQRDIEEKQKQMKYPDEKERLNIELNILQQQIANIDKEREQLIIPEARSSASLLGFFGSKKDQEKYDKEVNEYKKKDAALTNLQERYKKRILELLTPHRQLATTIQSALKRKQAEKIYKGMIDDEAAAATIQSAIKRKQAKQIYKGMIEKEATKAKKQAEREIAATTLQRAVRGAIKDTEAKEIYKDMIRKEEAKARKEAEYQTKIKLKKDFNTFNQIKNKPNLFYALKDMREKYAKWKDEYEYVYIKPLGYDDYFEKVVKDWIDETQAIIDERNQAERELAQQKKQEKIAAIQAKKEADAARREAQVAAFTSRPLITRTDALKLTEEDKEAIRNIQNVKDFERLKAKYEAGGDKKLIIKELKKKYEKWKEEYATVYFQPEGYERSLEHTAWMFLKDAQNEYEREKEEREEERKKSKVIVPPIGITIRTRSPPRAATRAAAKTPSPPRAAAKTPSPPRAATKSQRAKEAAEQAQAMIDRLKAKQKPKTPSPPRRPSPPRAARNYTRDELNAMTTSQIEALMDVDSEGTIRMATEGDTPQYRALSNAWQRANYRENKAKSGKGLARLSKAKKAPKISPTERMKNRLRLVTSQVQAGNTNPKLIVEVNKLYKKLYNIDNAYSLLKK